MRDYQGRVKKLAREALAGGRSTWRRQLRSSTLLGQLRHTDTQLPVFTFDDHELASRNNLVRRGELTRSARERRKNPGQLPQVAQTFADLAIRAPKGSVQKIELLALAASTWSLAGYQANSAALAHDYLAELGDDTQANPAEVEPLTAAAPAGIATLTGFILCRDVPSVARLGAMAELTLRQLERRFLGVASSETAPDFADAAVIAAYGLLARASRQLVRFWRLGDRHAGLDAVTDVRTARELVGDAAVVDTWMLLDNLSYVVEDIVATSPWRLLRRATTWNALWERYLRIQALTDHPIVQVWPSQSKVLEAGLLDRSQPNLTITMPTSAGKTHTAEWAILHALARPRPPEETTKLAVYVVPSRALAAEVERHLNRSLGPVGLRVSGLFGGAEHIDYEMNLIDSTDILVVTSEKFDLLLRNNETLGARLALLIADEGHVLGDGERGLRLEMLLTRVRRRYPAARLLLLSAVLPNGPELAGWLDPTGNHLAEIDWSPSTLRVGVFVWRGPEVDGQKGFVEYQSEDTDNQFFLPHVLVRRKKKTRLFPTEKKDIAAALAVHYQQLGPVLIVAPKRQSAVAAARAVVKSAGQTGFGADDNGILAPTVIAERNRAIEIIVDFGGANHPLVEMVEVGVGFHHSGVPETVRHALERAYRRGALQILCSTSTLAQGVNLPTKTVIISGTWHNQGVEMTVRDFRNTIGRAGRAFQETEGHAILVAGSPREASRLRNKYLDTANIEPVTSVLADLYVRLLRARLPGIRMQEAPIADTLDLPILAEIDQPLAEVFDLQLLELLTEEVVDTDDEDLITQAVETVLGDTYAGWQLGVRSINYRPLARFAASRVRQIRARVPDAAQRAAFLRTGLSLSGCEDALRAARAIAAAVQTDPDLLTEDRWPDLMLLVIHGAATVTEVVRAADRAKLPLAVLPNLAADWMSGQDLAALYAAHGPALGNPDSLTFAQMVDGVVVHDMAWALSAIVQLLTEEMSDSPLPPALGSIPAMAKYGVGTTTACMAASIGVRNRKDATTIGELFPTSFGNRFGQFLAWISALDPRALANAISPQTAAMFLDRASALATPREVLDFAVTGHGTVAVPLRGVRPMGTATTISEIRTGDEVDLVREHDNIADVNAIAVRTSTGSPLGYLAREYARIIAPMMDLLDGQMVTATVARRPPHSATPEELAAQDAIQIQVFVTPADA